MDSNSTNTRPPSRSGIPRPLSKLPVPRPALRPAPSSDKLYNNSVSELRLPRLRNSASKDTLRPVRNNASRESSVPPPRTQGFSASSIRDSLRDVSTGTVIHTPSKAPTIKRSNPALRSRISYDSFRRPANEAASSSVIRNGNQDVDGRAADNRTAQMRRARPSLSERTMETLAQLPPSPAVRNRGTSGGSRPGSSSNTDTTQGSAMRSVSSRPSSSGSQKADSDFRASSSSFKMPSNTPTRPITTYSNGTPSTVGSIKSSFGSVKRRSIVSPGFGSSRQRSPSPEKFAPLPTIQSGSKTIASRPLKPRASMTGLFRKPSVSNLDRQAPRKDDRTSKKISPTFSNTSSESTVSKSSRPTSISSASTVKESEEISTIPKASLTLREQIAQAKAAKKAQGQKAPGSISMAQTQTDVPIIPAGSFDFGLADDPFNQAIGEGGNKGLLRKRVDSARRDGRLNIAAMGLKEIPTEVMNMYDFESTGGGSWAETVDLTRFVAADNEFETLADEVFPDIDPKESMDDEDSKGSQFAGLETLDLHGNLLHSLPLGLRRLEFLTTLNLSNNKLQMDCFEILSQIPNLKDLKISNNLLSGPLSDHISGLRSLEVLHIEKNTLTSLPESLVNLVRLRVLNISGNMFASIPFNLLQKLPITELLAHKNKLTGALMDEQVKEMPNLQILDVTANSLTSLCKSDEILLPALHQLNCGANRLTALPDMSSWTSLLILIADDNSISEIPEGFVTLEKLKNVDFTGNNIKAIDERIGAMANLDIFRISGNPLREKKFSGMSTEDLKQALKLRMAPPEIEVEDETEDDDDTPIPRFDGTLPPTPTSPNRPSSPWTVKAGGTLDRSNTQSFSLNPVVAAQVASSNQIRTLELHHNLFKEIPNSIAFFATTLTSLNLSHNELTSDTFLVEGLDLPNLKSLNLSSNTFDSLLPLINRLFAPSLENLDISFNRLTSLPVLSNTFPNLRILNASNNTIRELNPESVKGLRILDCSSNELNSLNARIGLLGGKGGLERLDVRGNRFRVPRWEVLEKGTEATLAWLRDKIPNGELSDLGETF